MTNIVFTGRRVRVSKKTGKVLGPALRQGPRRVVSAKGTLARTVQGVLNRSLETKYCSNALQTPDWNGVLGTNLQVFTAFSSAITSTNELYSCLPYVGAGTSTNQRIGDRISPRGCHIALNFAVREDNVQSVDKTVHVFVLAPVSVKDLNNFDAIPIQSSLLDGGDSANYPFDGTNITAQYPVNKKAFRLLHHRTFRLVKGFGLPIGATGSTVGATDSVVSPNRSYKRLNLKVKCPTTLKYQLQNTGYPTNFAPVLCIGYVDNKAINGAPSAIDLMVMGTTHLYYKDS